MVRYMAHIFIVVFPSHFYRIPTSLGTYTTKKYIRESLQLCSEQAGGLSMSAGVCSAVFMCECVVCAPGNSAEVKRFCRVLRLLERAVAALCQPDLHLSELVIPFLPPCALYRCIRATCTVGKVEMSNNSQMPTKKVVRVMWCWCECYLKLITYCFRLLQAFRKVYLTFRQTV